MRPDQSLHYLEAALKLTPRFVLFLALVLTGPNSLSGQVGNAREYGEAIEAQVDPTRFGAVVDQRLVAPPPITRQVSGPSFSLAGSELLLRRESRLTYPLAGAVIGAAAGAIYAKTKHSGENALGFPIDPVLIFAPVGAIAGALIGAIIDPNAER